LLDTLTGNSTYLVCDIYTQRESRFVSSRPSRLICGARAYVYYVRGRSSLPHYARGGCSLLKTLQESEEEGRRSNDMSYHGSNFIIGQRAVERLASVL